MSIVVGLSFLFYRWLFVGEMSVSVVLIMRNRLMLSVMLLCFVWCISYVLCMSVSMLLIRNVWV